MEQAKGKCGVGRRRGNGRVIAPEGIGKADSVVDLIDNTFLAYNAARLREACGVFVEKMLEGKSTVGMTLAGALTPAGVGCSCIVPLIKAGFVDWIVSTGANLYHDVHFALNLPMMAGTPNVDDIELRETGFVRIYDVILEFDTLIKTDEVLRKWMARKEFQHEMGTAELHYRLGRLCARLEDRDNRKNVSVLAAAYRAGVPVYTSSPGDSAIGMNLSRMALDGGACKLDPLLDVNETAAIVLDAKRGGGAHSVVLVGGGSPKNFILQTEPHIQEILNIEGTGHDYFIQFTDARPDTGGLSGASPQEAASWGKVDPTKLPDAVVCYLDATVALPLLTQYALAKRRKRKLKRIYDRRQECLDELISEMGK